MDNNNMNMKQTLQLLGIQEVTTKRQKKNGTREFKLPIKDLYCSKGSYIHVASFASGYVRRTKAGGYCPNWQLNKRIETDPEYFKDYEWVNGDQVWTGKYRKFTCKGSKLIPDEQDRLAYLISYCLKNYYINRANIVARSSDKYVPKWIYEGDLKEANEKYNNLADAARLDCEHDGVARWRDSQVPEVKVIVNGHRYNVI